jgi:hypothetical protein
MRKIQVIDQSTPRAITVRVQQPPKLFTVVVTEILNREVVVKASDEQEAWNKVNNMHTEGKIILDYDDWANTEIEVRESEEA